MIASSRVQPPPSRAARVRLSERLAHGLAAAHRMLEDVVLPSRGAHPAIGLREIDRI